MKILVTGADGQLGKAVVNRAASRGDEVLAMDLPKLDITRPDHIQAAGRHFKPDIIVNAAGYTDVDRAESDHKSAFSVNRDGPENLANVCRDLGIPLVHISTDYVFDGKSDRPYTEKDCCHPIGVYAKSKAAGESALRASWEKHIIIRTSWLYSATGKNFVKTMLQVGRAKNRIKVVADQRGCPTSVTDLAQVIHTVSHAVFQKGRSLWGTYHYCGSGITSWYAFAVAIFQFAAAYGYPKVPQITPIATAQYPTAAQRPAFSALDCGKIMETFGILQRPWQKSLSDVVKALLK